MSNGVRYTPTFAMPSEYERQAIEARRRRRMAEMLAAQAYQPQEGGVAPIPTAAPLVQGLQAFLTARQLKKAEEAEEKAQQADVKGVQDLIEKLSPKEFAGAEAAVEEMRQTAKPGVLSRDGTYTPSTIMPGTAPVEMPYIEAAPTGKERQNILLQTQFGGSPRAADLAKALMAQSKPEEFTIESTGRGLMRVGKTTGEASPVMYGGEVLMPRDAYSMGMTPQQKQQYDLDVLKFGVDEAQARLARAKAADEGIDVSAVNIPSAFGASRVTPQVAPTPVQVPSVTPAQMRMGMEGVPTVARPPSTARMPVSTATVGVTGQPSTTGGRRVPQLQDPAIPEVEKRKLRIVEPETRKSISTGLTGAQRLINMAEDLSNHSGVNQIAGPIAKYEITDVFKNKPANSARDLYNSMVSQIGLLKVQAAKDESTTGASGYGALTKEEWPRLEQSLAAVGLSDPESFDLNLKNFIEEVKAVMGGSKDLYESKYGSLDWKPVKYEPVSKLYPRAKQKISDNRAAARALVGISPDGSVD